MRKNAGLLNGVSLPMQRIINYFWMSLILVSCGTAEDSRYRDTALLERPPTLVIPKPSGVKYEADESSIPKKQEPGLGEEIYMTSSTPPKLIIKKSFDKTWNTLNQAIKLNEIKITDQERNKGHLYVGYDASSFFEKVTAFIKDGHKATIYLLSVEEKGVETEITASRANSNEQTIAIDKQDKNSKKPADDSQALLETLYKTIHDDLVEE